MDAKLYGQVKAEAKAKFQVYPSIYANSWLSREYKRRGGAYACSSEPQRGGLERWYAEKWVDLSRPLAGGGWAACGRPKADGTDWRRAYPKCRPLAEAEKMTPAEIESAVRRKRKAVAGSEPGKPVYVPTFAENPSTGLVGGALGLGALVLGVAWWYRRYYG